MIAAHELRIGNWVDTPKGIKQVTGIVSGSHVSVVHFDKIDHHAHCATHLCDPILLSPEILEKCGFENLKIEMSGCQVWNIPNTHWRIAMSYRDEICFRLWHKQVSPPTWLLSEFLYLHQLQNLYYCLVGQKLQINF